MLHIILFWSDVLKFYFWIISSTLCNLRHFCFDMFVQVIPVYYKSYNSVLQVKPLGVIWGKFDQYSSRNTIMFDDIRRNFLMNPGNGLKIRPFRQAHLNRDKDRELLKLAKYLKDIVHEEDFNSLDHKHWEKYRPRKKDKHTVKKESGDLGDNRDNSNAS